MIEDNPLIFAPHSISAETFRRVLRAARSPAFVETDALLAALDAWGADRGIALAFFAKESSYGQRGVAVRTRNWGNLRRGKRMVAQTPHPFAVYARWADGLNDWCELLKEHYCKRRGLCRLRQILPRYAPPSDGNNPERYADFVVALVRRWQREERGGHR